MMPPFIADEGCEQTYPADPFAAWWSLVWLACLVQMNQIADATLTRLQLPRALSLGASW